MPKYDTDHRGSWGGWTDQPVPVYIAEVLFETADRHGNATPRAGDLADLLSAEHFTQISAREIRLRIEAPSEAERDRLLKHFTDVAEEAAGKAGFKLREAAPAPHPAD